MIVVTLDKQGDTAESQVVDGRAIIDVTSERGIGGLQARLLSGEWPDEVIVRLHLKGLERLEIGYDQYLVASGVSSTSQPAPLPTVYAIDDTNQATVVVDAGADFYPTIDVIPEEGSQASIPLQNGYFEISLPPNFFVGRPQCVYDAVDRLLSLGVSSAPATNRCASAGRGSGRRRGRRS